MIKTLRYFSFFVNRRVNKSFYPYHLIVWLETRVLCQVTHITDSYFSQGFVAVT